MSSTQFNGTSSYDDSIDRPSSTSKSEIVKVVEQSKKAISSGLANLTSGHSNGSPKAQPILDITKDLSALIRKQILATPTAIALEDENTKLTYAELDQKVNVLTAHLRAYGVKRDSLVGVLLGRSANYVVACLAALRAGGAFLVLELAYPLSLLADVIEDAQPVVIITHRAQAGMIKADVPLIVLDE